MYFPEYNAILVPAESISPDYLPSSKRKKPIGGLLRLIKQRMELADSKEDSLENASISSEKDSRDSSMSVDGVTTLKNKLEESNASTSTEPASSEEIADLQKPDSHPTVKPNSFLTSAEELPFPQTEQKKPQVAQSPSHEQSNDQQVREQRPQANTFGPFAQYFQRPTTTQYFPETTYPEDGLQYPEPQQPSRPTFISFLPSTVTSYFQNPPKRPISNFIENRFPLLAPYVAPRNPYIHYYTKTPTSEAFYFNSLHPTAYSDVVESQITDYVNRVQESLLSEHELAKPPISDAESAMMVASVPMGKNQATSLVLRPVAKAVAGPKGVAVASPVARAVLRKGEKVDIDFDPDAVAIAGPGGQAHAHPKLIISYTNEKTDESSEEKSTKTD